MGLSYKVKMTPLLSDDVYGVEIDVTDHILQTGIGRIKRGTDGTDYDFGVYVYDDISLRGDNPDGFFSDETDSRSIFQYSRDRTLVEIIASRFTVDASGVETITDTINFKGMINEEATRDNVASQDVNFKVLSRDSVIRNTRVNAGAISNGVTAKSALETILNVPRITSVLNFTSSNITPDLDFVIDDGSKFDNQSTRDVLNDIMLGANSVMIVDLSLNMIVKSRDEDTVKDVKNLFGKSDILGRENIISISRYNTGFHRVFNSVNVNGTEASNNSFEKAFGSKTKSLTLDFITDAATELEIAARLLNEFKTQKIELLLQLDIDEIEGVELLDRVSINYPLRIGMPADGFFLPVIGVAKIDDSLTPLPTSFGPISIEPETAFKVIEIVEDASRFKATMKLRQVGTE